jgi:uncharacterized membrane protein
MHLHLKEYYTCNTKMEIANIDTFDSPTYILVSLLVNVFINQQTPLILIIITITAKGN